MVYLYKRNKEREEGSYFRLTSVEKRKFQFKKYPFAVDYHSDSSVERRLLNFEPVNKLINFLESNNLEYAVHFYGENNRGDFLKFEYNKNNHNQDVYDRICWLIGGESTGRISKLVHILVEDKFIWASICGMRVYLTKESGEQVIEQLGWNAV